MLKRIIGIFLAGALALSLFLAVGCSAPDGQQNDPGGAQIETPGEEEPGGEVPGEDLPAGGDEDEVPEYTVTYYDSDGTTVLATEKFAEGEILANRNLGADRAGYSKSWRIKRGTPFRSVPPSKRIFRSICGTILRAQQNYIRATFWIKSKRLPQLTFLLRKIHIGITAILR